MPLASSFAARPCACRIAWSATSHGLSLMSAVIVPCTSLPTTMVRPENVANAAMTSRMSVPSNFTVMRGFCCWRRIGAVRRGAFHALRSVLELLAVSLTGDARVVDERLRIARRRCGPRCDSAVCAARLPAGRLLLVARRFSAWGFVARSVVARRGGLRHCDRAPLQPTSPGVHRSPSARTSRAGAWSETAERAAVAAHRVLAGRIEIDDDAHGVTLVLREAHVAHRATRAAVIARRASRGLRRPGRGRGATVRRA